jgi:hypothetical protein
MIFLHLFDNSELTITKAGVYNGGPGGCYNDACTIGSNCLSCSNAVNGAKWATASRAMAKGARAGSVSSLSFGPGGKAVGAKPKNGRRSVESDQIQRPPNSGNSVGATTNRPKNVGATPNRPKNVGATPIDPLQELLNQLKGDAPPEYPQYPDHNSGDSNTGNTVGADRRNPWADWLAKLQQAGRRDGPRGRKIKRDAGRTVTPNRATIGGHQFNLELMPNDERLEIYTAIFNHTQYTDLATGLLNYEITQD